MKIIIIGIGEILKNNSLVSLLPNETVIKFLNFAMRMLLKQRKEESLSLKRQLKKDIECNFVSSGSEDEDGDEDSNDDENEISL